MFVLSTYDGTGIVTNQPWNFFQLQSSDGVPVSNPIDLIGTPGSDISTTQPWLWNGSGFVRVTSLSTGT